ncbi:hypothetical protein [Streptomyces sp. enrichment culture]|uniref:hypothetical protein n=1 Tax=Streptomyces sp. enrichment culture TaxID=1795815 RepID=UPI003F559930
MAVTAWAAGQRITADRLNEMLPRWQSWTPTWSTSSGSATPSFGNATMSCSYCQTGDVVLIRMKIAFGTTTNFGGGGSTDNWRFSTPVTAASTSLMIGTGEAQDSDTGTSPSVVRVPLRARLTTTTGIEFETTGGATSSSSTSVGICDAVTPFTWAASDVIRF